ncbi:Glucan endo-1,3-beta-glucosidase 11 [Spatholobus suberectus]|nr:Glucan endo-1,3-beta-glucosidase 11 [Spatholobus suberectus]
MQRFILLPTLIFYLTLLTLAGGSSIGVNYGRVASNLPSAFKVVKLLKSSGIDRVKLYDADPAVLRALSGSGIKVTVNLPNEQLHAAAKKPSFALSWVERNVAVYHPRTQIEAIAVGNEVFADPHNRTASHLVRAMRNVHEALVKRGLHPFVKVSSPIALSALGSSYPSSSGSFRPELVEPVLKPMLDFLRETASYLMVNVYPFFAYESNADVIPLDYALFRANPGSVDPGSGLRYFNLFDAQVDAVFAALSALRYDDVRVVVSETGWPSKGDGHEVGASPRNAAAYNGNLARRILSGGTGSGTPLRPHANLTVYLFALFNEDRKAGPTSERNFGLFYPDMRKVYDVPFAAAGTEKGPSPAGTAPVAAAGGRARRGAWRTRARGRGGCRKGWITRAERGAWTAVRFRWVPRVTILTRLWLMRRSRSTGIIRRGGVRSGVATSMVRPTWSRSSLGMVPVNFPRETEI